MSYNCGCAINPPDPPEETCHKTNVYYDIIKKLHVIDVVLVVLNDTFMNNPNTTYYDKQTKKLYKTNNQGIHELYYTDVCIRIQNINNLCNTTQLELPFKIDTNYKLTDNIQSTQNAIFEIYDGYSAINYGIGLDQGSIIYYGNIKINCFENGSLVVDYTTDCATLKMYVNGKYIKKRCRHTYFW